MATTKAASTTPKTAPVKKGVSPKAAPTKKLAAPKAAATQTAIAAKAVPEKKLAKPKSAVTVQQPTPMPRLAWPFPTYEKP